MVSRVRYTESHEWIRWEEGENIGTVGITDHAQDLLGDLVFVELPKIGAVLAQGQEAGVVESVKAASDVYAPVSGKVIKQNEVLDQSPGVVNQSAEQEGWLYQIEITHPDELEKLLDQKNYLAAVG